MNNSHFISDNTNYIKTNVVTKSGKFISDKSSSKNNFSSVVPKASTYQNSNGSEYNIKGATASSWSIKIK